MIKNSLLVAAAFALSLFAVQTNSWIHNTQGDFEKGTLENLSLRSDGRLLLSPAFREIADPSIAYLWALGVDSKGTVYAGGGGPNSATARLIAVDSAGKMRVAADLPGLQIQAIAIDAKDRVYAATIPDGKVYRITGDNQHEVFYDPKAKYVWALAFNSKGELFVATGDTGEIHRVQADGKGDVFFDTEETHVRALVVDSKDNVVAGTEPGGLVLRISPAAEGFVLYQAEKREVTALAVASDGSIYAAAVGNKGPAAPGLTAPRTVPVQPVKPQASAVTSNTQQQPAGPQPGAAKPQPAPPAASVAGGSEVYRIGADNYPQRVWSHPQDVVYALVLDSSGRPIAGTGNEGHIYRIDSELVSTLLIDASTTQITALASGPQQRLYAATGNVGKLYQIGPGFAKQGSYESEPLDVGFFSYWGRAGHKQELNGGQVRMQTRSGNLDRPQKNWSSWAAVDPKTSRVQSPFARFLQYRVTLEAGTGTQSPEVREVEVAYMAKNVAPQLQEVEITPANYRFTATTTMPSTSAPQNITLPPLGPSRRPSTTPPRITTASASQSMQFSRGFTGARWLVTDPNEDDMIYKVEIRGLNEREWKLVKEKVLDTFLSWDSTAYPDGEYIVRVTASDAPGNPPDKALESVIVSDRFTIDNTPPAISNLTGSRSGGKLAVKWHARDERNIIKRAEYSVNGGDWTIVEPATGLSDALELDYSIEVAPSGSETTVAVRVTDEFENQAVDKVVIR